MSDPLSAVVTTLLSAGLNLIEQAQALAIKNGMSPDDLDALEKEITSKRQDVISDAKKKELEILNG